MSKQLNKMKAIQQTANLTKHQKLQVKIKRKAYLQKTMIKKKNCKIKIDKSLLRRKTLKSQIT